MGDFFMEKSYLQKVKYIRNAFNGWDDIVIKEITIGIGIKMLVCYIDDLIDRDMLEENVIKGLLVDIALTGVSESNCVEEYINRGIISADYKDVDNIDEGIAQVLTGNTLLIFEKRSSLIVVSTKGFPKRGIDKPETEIAVQGPQEAFSESLRTNTVLIRRRIRDTSLKCKQFQVGEISKTDVAIMYIEGIARAEVVMELERRIKSVAVDVVLDSGYMEQLMNKNIKTPFPMAQLTERPDKVGAELTQGRVAVIVDNSPFVILLPVVLASFYQASEDYYQGWQISSFIRIIRYIAGFLAFALPGLYIAITVYSPSILPLELVLRLAEARKSVPIPTVLEVVVMELAFEALREAGIRLPSSIGSTLGIVGGIVVGQAAVDAGLISPMVVIIISLTGICSFAIPNISLVSTYRLLKYFVIFLSAVFGMPGFVFSILTILIHLVKLSCYGVPYLYPFGGMEKTIGEDLKDTIFRFPLCSMKKRPVFAEDKNKKRMR